MAKTEQGMKVYPRHVNKFDKRVVRGMVGYGRGCCNSNEAGINRVITSKKQDRTEIKHGG